MAFILLSSSRNHPSLIPSSSLPSSSFPHPFILLPSFLIHPPYLHPFIFLPSSRHPPYLHPFILLPSSRHPPSLIPSSSLPSSLHPPSLIPSSFFPHPFYFVPHPFIFLPTSLSTFLHPPSFLLNIQNIHFHSNLSNTYWGGGGGPFKRSVNQLSTNPSLNPSQSSHHSALPDSLLIIPLYHLTSCMNVSTHSAKELSAMTAVITVLYTWHSAAWSVTLGLH